MGEWRLPYLPLLIIGIWVFVYMLLRLDCPPLAEFGWRTLSSRLWCNRPSWNIGRIATEETKAKMSLAHMGNQRALGCIHPIESRIKMSQFHKGKKWGLGYKHTEEAKAKISLARKATKKD